MIAVAIAAVSVVAARPTDASHTATAAPVASCDAPVNVPHVGPACPLPSGLWEVLLDDGTTVTTHGPDPASSTSTSRFASVPGQVKPACVTRTNDEFHIRVVYTVASDKPDRYTQRLWEVRALVNQANGFLRDQGAKFGRPVRLRVACSGGEASVTRLRLQTTDERTTFSSIISEMRAAGMVDPLVKYWIWHDGPPRGALGISTIRSDSSLRAENANNFGPSYSATFGLGVREGGWTTMLHEISHALGAVQTDAPNASMSFHCNDGQDIMCYPDNTNATLYKNNVCRDEAFDCKHNDYFHPNPPKKSYLRTHWNLATPLHRFVRGCTYLTGEIDAGLRGEEVGDRSFQDHKIAKSCRGKRFGLSGIFLAPYSAVKTAGRSVPDCIVVCGVSQVAGAALVDASARATPNFDACFFKKSKRLRCFSASTTDTGIVPKAATKVRIILHTGVKATYVFNAI